MNKNQFQTSLSDPLELLLELPDMKFLGKIGNLTGFLDGGESGDDDDPKLAVTAFLLCTFREISTHA